MVPIVEHRRPCFGSPAPRIKAGRRVASARMKRERLVVVAAMLALLAGGVSWWALRRTTNEVPNRNSQVTAPGMTAVPPEPLTAPRGSTASPEQAQAVAAVAKPVRNDVRIELPPPPPTPGDSTLTAATPGSRLTDRRINPGPNAHSEREQLNYAVETLDDDIEECLAQWSKSQVPTSGEVMVAIEIDTKGMEKAWVEREGDVPLGPRTCFANAAYGIDWSHMVDSPVKITRRYAFPTDGGS